MDPWRTSSRITVLFYLAACSLEGLTVKNLEKDLLEIRPCCRLKTVVAANTGCLAVLAPGWFISVRGSYKMGWCLLPRDSLFSTIISILGLIFRL